MRKQSAESPARSAGLKPDPPLARMPRTRKEITVRL